MTLLEYITRHITILEDRSIALFAIGAMTALLSGAFIRSNIRPIVSRVGRVGLGRKIGSQWKSRRCGISLELLLIVTQLFIKFIKIQSRVQI